MTDELFILLIVGMSLAFLAFALIMVVRETGNEFGKNAGIHSDSDVLPQAFSEGQAAIEARSVPDSKDDEDLTDEEWELHKQAHDLICRGGGTDAEFAAWCERYKDKKNLMEVVAMSVRLWQLWKKVDES